jgi:hypothetical protein
MKLSSSLGSKFRVFHLMEASFLKHEVFGSDEIFLVDVTQIGVEYLVCLFVTVVKF